MTLLNSAPLMTLFPKLGYLENAMFRAKYACRAQIRVVHH